MLALLLALQAALPAPGAAASLGDAGGTWCLETGYCRSPDDGYRTPPAGALFLATGLVGFGVVTLARRNRGAAWPG
jgi:hypothetical protein